MHVVYYWIERGHISAQRRKPGLPYAITITDSTDRLRSRVQRSRSLFRFPGQRLT
jgi:hypothetical protein